MKIACPACATRLSIPDERASNPRMKVKCRCGSVFALGEAEVVDVPAAPKVAELSVAPAPLVTAARPPAAPAPPVAVSAAITVPAPTPVPAAVQARPAGAPATRPASPASRRAAPTGWRRCHQHPDVPSIHVCPGCSRGFCADCAPLVNNVAVCEPCDRPCVPAEKHLEMQERERHRGRPLRADLRLIALYPLGDPWAYVLLAVFTWFFGLLRPFGFIAVVLSSGVLASYTFNSLLKVSIGKLRDFMPDFTDLADLSLPLRLGLAALVVSALPFFLVTVFLVPMETVRALSPRRAQPPPTTAPAATASPDADAGDDEGPVRPDDQAGFEKAEQMKQGRRPVEVEDYAEPGVPVWAWILFALAVAWRVVYMPVALTVAAISRSFLSTFNPVLGLQTIHGMGSVYWEVTAAYTAMMVVQWGLGVGLSYIPILGGLLAAFVNAYVALVTGCLLGLAVFKKGRELGWE